tara:strand:- start:467 stop:1417 length:951 start_codon:yes stop_codon:yes gene_type:complete
MINKQKNAYLDLKINWESLLKNDNNLRIRDAASKLGVSEAELLSTEIGDTTSYLSIDNYYEFFKNILKLNKVMFLVRNDFVVHEKIITALSYILKENYIMSKDGNRLIDVNFNNIKYAFFQKKKHKKIELKSFQLFDNNGNSIIKIYLKDDNHNPFDKIAEKYKKKYLYELQSQDLTLQNNSNYYTFQDINVFYKQRQTNSHSHKIAGKNFRSIIDKVSDYKIKIQIILVSKNIIQYHEDKLIKIVDYGPWYNILDKNFNLHILEKKIHHLEIHNLSTSEIDYHLINVLDENDNTILALSSSSGYEKQFSNIIKEI